MNIENILSFPDREKRFDEITVDCYDEYEARADQLWVDETGSANAIMLDDYRAYVAA